MESHQVEELLTKAAAQGKLRHVVYVSSVGAEKAGFQFTLDSLGGALERKKGVEQAVRRLAKALGFSYSIVRVGALGAAKAGRRPCCSSRPTRWRARRRCPRRRRRCCSPWRSRRH